jgi:hypothetical protein
MSGRYALDEDVILLPESLSSKKCSCFLFNSLFSVKHAYYVDYRNVRPDYVNAIWDITNWDVVESRLVAARD